MRERDWGGGGGEGAEGGMPHCQLSFDQVLKDYAYQQYQSLPAFSLWRVGRTPPPPPPPPPALRDRGAQLSLSR